MPSYESGSFQGGRLQVQPVDRRRLLATYPLANEAAMTDTVEALILDLLEWIGPESRPYAEVIEAWRTSCPRLPVWEEANQRGLPGAPSRARSRDLPVGVSPRSRAPPGRAA